MKLFKLISIASMSLLIASCADQKKQKTTPKEKTSKQIDTVKTDIKSELKNEGRLLKLEGPVNFRDLGGVKTKSNNSVKKGLIYRSDKLSLLTAADYNVLDSLNIKNIIDFRTKGEVEKEPYKVPSDVIYKNLPIGDDSWSKEDFMGEIAQIEIEEFEQMMVGIYKSMPVEYPEQYRKFFESILQSNKPLVFHCTAGKDRTGVASALLLNLLGVDWEIIKADYELSSDYRMKENLKMAEQLKTYGISKEKTMMMMGVKAPYLDSIFNAISNNYGSLDSYYKDALELDSTKIALIKNKYLN